LQERIIIVNKNVIDFFPRCILVPLSNRTNGLEHYRSYVLGNINNGEEPVWDCDEANKAKVGDFIFFCRGNGAKVDGPHGDGKAIGYRIVKILPAYMRPKEWNINNPEHRDRKVLVLSGRPTYKNTYINLCEQIKYPKYCGGPANREDKTKNPRLYGTTIHKVL
jgi:hypothetical protein